MATQLPPIDDSHPSEDNNIGSIPGPGQHLKKARRDPCTRIACDNCRSKKLKCTGEQEGCQRCLSKGYNCFYGGIGSRSSPPVNKTLAPYSERQLSVSPRGTMTCNIETGGFNFGFGEMHCLDLGTRDSPTAQAVDVITAEAFDDFISSLTQESAELDCSDMIEIDSDPTTSFLSTAINCASSSDTAHSRGVFNHATSERSINGNCACVGKAMLTNEDVCINVLWTIRRATNPQSAEAPGIGISPSAVAEMLQCIKRTTRSNEELLSCHMSCGSPGVMALIIMMCDIMLNGLESLVQQLRHDNLSSDMEQNEHNPQMKIPVTTKASSATQPPKGFYNKQCLKSRRGMGANDSTSRPFGTRVGRGQDNESERISVTDIQQPTFHISPWILDKEDETRVLDSLIAGRLENLSGLVGKLQHVGSRNQQLVYKEAITNLCKRLNVIYIYK